MVRSSPLDFQIGKYLAPARGEHGAGLEIYPVTGGQEMKLIRLPVVLLLLSVFLAGCFSSSTSKRVVDDPVQLVTDVDALDPGGPRYQQVVVSAYSSSGKTITADDLLIQGVTADGRLVNLNGVKAEDREVSAASEDGRTEIVLTIDLQELLAQGIVRIQISLQTDPLRFVVIAVLTDEPGQEPGNPDEDEPGEPGEEPGDPHEPGEPGGPDEPGDPGEEPGEPGNGSDDPGEPGEEPTDPGEEPGQPEPEPELPRQTVEIRTLRAGTSQATEVYIIRSINPGPAVVVVGGMHGS